MHIGHLQLFTAILVSEELLSRERFVVLALINNGSKVTLKSHRSNYKKEAHQWGQ